MIGFDLDRFLKEQKLSAKEFADRVDCSIATVYFIKERGTIKPTFLRKLEEVYGDCSQYLQVEKAEAV